VKVALEGDPAAGVSGVEFTGFSDPLVNSNLDVAFIGTIKGGNVNSKTKTGIWFASTRVGGELAISHETIYRHVWRDLKAGGTLHAHLRCARKQWP
jgi:hypothetical protein